MILSFTKNKNSSILSILLLLSIFAISQVAAQQFEEMPDKRLLGGCDTNCSVCNSTGLCAECVNEDFFDLINGTCYTRYYLNGTFYTKDQRGLYFYVDANGSDVAVDVIFGILAAVAFAGFYFLAHKQDWKPWVPEPPAEAKENKGKESAEGEIDGQQPKQVAKLPKAIDDGIDLGGTSKQEGEEEEEGDQELGTKKKADGDEDEDAYYPNMKNSPSKSSKSKHEESRNNSKVEVNMEDEIEDAVNAGRTSVKSIKSNFAQNTPKSVRSQLTSPKTHLSPKTMISPKSHLSPKSHISPKSQVGSKKGSPVSKRRGSKSSNSESHRSDKEVHEEQVQEEEQEEQEEEQEEVAENDSRHDEELEEEEDNVVTLDAAFNANTQPAHTEDNDPNSSNTGFMVGSDSKRYKR